MTTISKVEFAKAKEELKAAGWEQISTVSCGDSGLKYGSHFVKQGKTFFLNKDTYMKGFTGDKMAVMCDPIFN